VNLLDKYRAKLKEVAPAASPKVVQNILEREDQKVAPLLVKCAVCHENAWWESRYGRLVCGVCHPPVPGAIRKWIGNPDAYARMKALKPSVLLSFEDFRRRLQDGQ
jgi:hypothetical protein